MKAPCFRIAWLRVAVAIGGLDCGTARVAVKRTDPATDLVVVGVLPMANILLVGLLVGQRRCDVRPFLLGCETFGAAALAAYVLLASLLSNETVNPDVDLFLRPL